MKPIYKINHNYSNKYLHHIPYHPYKQKIHSASMKKIGGVKWGYINSKGNFVIKPMYDFSYDFQDNDLAIVKVNDAYGVIDKSGKYIVKPKYRYITPYFSEGRTIARDSEGAKVIDERGNEITKKPYYHIDTYKEGRAIIQADEVGNYLYGYIDKYGNEVISYKYKFARRFNNNRALVKTIDNKYALIDLNGKVINTYPYFDVGQLSNGLLRIRDNNGKYGYINESGNVVISPQYDSAGSFNEGRAIISIFNFFTIKNGLIDKMGNYILKPDYDEIIFLGEERVAVGKLIDEKHSYSGYKFAIVDTNGNFLTDYIYYDVSQYKDGFSTVYDNENTFFINRSGKRAENLPWIKGSAVLSLEKDLIKIYKVYRTFYQGRVLRTPVDNRIVYINRLGSLIYKQNKIINLNNVYRVVEHKYNPNDFHVAYYPQIKGMKSKINQEVVNEKLKKISIIKPEPSQYDKSEYIFFLDFDVKFYKKKLLVLKLLGDKIYLGPGFWHPKINYYHINLESGKLYEIKDLFKQNSDYVKVISDIIEEMKDSKIQSHIKGIDKNQSFYITKDGLNIFYPKTASYTTFTISFEDIMNIIDTNGELWKSFN